MVACIEAELRRINLWEASPPAADRIASRQPFCCDTLSCAQWLQWQFLPRMQSLLQNGEALPDSCAIFPYAEYCFDGVEKNTHKLLTLIRQFDELISGSHAVQGGSG